MLKHKSEAFGEFKEFKALAEGEKNTKIKCLRSDRGGEFSSDEFTEFYLIGLKWIFRVKRNAKGDIVKHKFVRFFSGFITAAHRLEL
ncbi:unnamed protein product [Spirodela intermedia]|uniref:Uncharacterized protein n=1 Tax=Spirodela intermedia TaxID=51605 RepID=A0A7I8K3C6_SPIIN|nr:unnamed protein product [Spirodela intermedia]